MHNMIYIQEKLPKYVCYLNTRQMHLINGASPILKFELNLNITIYWINHHLPFIQ